MIREFCENALKELSNYKSGDRESIMLERINERLDKSFSTYQEELNQGIEYLKRRNDLNVARKMRRL